LTEKAGLNSRRAYGGKRDGHISSHSFRRQLQQQGGKEPENQSSTQRLVWRGTASGTISSKQEKNEKALNTALTKMFENFPQAPGKK